MKEIRFKRVVCDFCGSGNFTKLFSAKDYYHKRRGLFGVVKCNECGLVYSNPRPPSQAMNYFYTASVGYYQPQKYRKKTGFKQKIKAILLREYYDYFPNEKSNILVKLVLFPFYVYTYRYMKKIGLPKFVKNGKLLDIGCSYGGFIYAMKELGWDVKGIEMNKDMVKWGQKNFQVNISYGRMDSFHAKEKFDVITMRMVLEHVYSPKKALSKVKNILKPNGLLIIIIPDFGGFESKLYGQYAYTLQVPTHLTHFTSTTIKNYLSSLNFRNIKIYHQNLDRDLIAPLEYMRRDGRETQLPLTLMSNKMVRNSVIRLIVEILSLLGKSSRMTVYARKQ